MHLKLQQPHRSLSSYQASPSIWKINFFSINQKNQITINNNEPYFSFDTKTTSIVDNAFANPSNSLSSSLRFVTQNGKRWRHMKHIIKNMGIRKYIACMLTKKLTTWWIDRRFTNTY